MNSAASTFRFPFCELATEASSAPPCGVRELPDRAARGRAARTAGGTASPRRVAVDDRHRADRLADQAVDRPAGRPACRAGGVERRPAGHAGPGPARLGWMLGDLRQIDAQDEPAGITEVLKQHGYLDAFDRDPRVARQLCQAVQGAGADVARRGRGGAGTRRRRRGCLRAAARG